ncbi:MAG: MYXO-CTERM domain-containing protein [Polyangiales bacterium]|jgi:MYXO-CTERM domain-containing protein
MKTWLFALSLMTLGFVFGSPAYAFPSYGANIPNGRINSSLPAGEGNTRCWVCHNSTHGGYGSDCSGPSCLNAFGIDFSTPAAGHVAYGWDRWIAAVDSDNDGWSNGHELRSNWGGTTTNSNRYTLPGNPASLNCSIIPTDTSARMNLRAACSSELNSTNYSSYATGSRFEPRDNIFNLCSSADTSDCASTASCSRSAFNGRGDWSCTCNAGYSGTGFRRTTNHDFTPPNGSLGDDRLYSIRSALVGGCADINECSGNPCTSNGSCSQTAAGTSPGYTCNCASGYRFNGSSCVVSNECALTPGICGEGTCVERAPPETYICNCDAGYVFSGGTCVADNACVANLDDCDSLHGVCSSSSGSDWDCTCDPGWVGTGTRFRGTGDRCSDVNECSGSNPCGLGSCQNLAGSYNCMCPSGYAFNGTTCVDINECRAGDPCGVGGTACTNSAGSYACTCSAGYVFGGGTCQDIDECASMPCGAGTCTQEEPPRYTCDCDIGYFFDGTSCLDIDECDDPAVALCSLQATCANTPGSHICTCIAGYEGDGGACSDIDECLNASTNECAVNARCENTPGAYDCECNEGFTGSGLVCSDVDECATPNVCGLNQTCVDNAAGLAPECVCSEGFARDETGEDCVPACGDGARTVTESCDDGNTTDGDGCSAACDTEDGFVCWESPEGLSECANTCGDGLIDRGETCDDGDDNSDTEPAACRTTCQMPACGDGILDEGETCDEGDSNTNDDPAGCRTTCLDAFCGDEIVDEGETCDPGGGETLPEESCMCGDAGPQDGGVDASEDPGGPSGGGGCAVGGESSPLGLGTLLGLVLFWRRRRR